MSRPVVPGDVICVKRGIYDHYGIYSGKGHVIHYATDFDKRLAPFIHEVTLSEFLDNDSSFYVCEFMSRYEGRNHQELANGLADMFSVPVASIFSMPDNRTIERAWKEENYKLYSQSETLERAKGQMKIVANEDLWERTYKGIFSLVLPDVVLEPSDKFYGLFSNNCEHFVTWCKTGVLDSMQINELAALISVPRTSIQH